LVGIFIGRSSKKFMFFVVDWRYTKEARKRLLIVFKQRMNVLLIKDEVLLMVDCPIFPPFYIDSQIVHRKFKKISKLIFRNAKEIYFNEKFPIL
jgi:hypothetical protein